MANKTNDGKTGKVVQDEQRDEENKRKFVGPEGVAAQDLPGGGREGMSADRHEELTRNLPQQHGGEMGEEGGLRGDRDINDADIHGGPKRN